MILSSDETPEESACPAQPTMRPLTLLIWISSLIFYKAASQTSPYRWGWLAALLDF
jgi:hypothetical protein